MTVFWKWIEHLNRLGLARHVHTDTAAAAAAVVAAATGLPYYLPYYYLPYYYLPYYLPYYYYQPYYYLT